MQHTPTVWNPSSLHFIQHHANINTYGGGNCDAWVVVHLSAHQSRPIHFLRLIAARKFASKTFSGSSTEKTIREKKMAEKGGFYDALFISGISMCLRQVLLLFFSDIWLVFKKRGQDSSLSILFGRRKKKGTARKVLLVWRHRQSSDDKSLNSHRCSTNTERENPCVCVWLRDADLRVA